MTALYNAGPVYLVGGGTSLIGFDFDQLRGETVVAINDALLYLPWATASFSADPDWIQGRLNVLRNFNGERCLATSTFTPDFPARVFCKVRSRALSDDPTALHVLGSSGYGAVNLAYLLGAKRIVLLGFDFYDANKRWYPDYPWSPMTRDKDSTYALWASAFDSMLPQLQKSKVQVVNASMDSRIAAFPKISLEALV